jgi:hypothetical protein
VSAPTLHATKPIRQSLTPSASPQMSWAQILQHAANCNGNHAPRQPNSRADNAERNIADLCEDVVGPGRLRWYVARIKEDFNPQGSAIVRRPVSAVLSGLPCPTLHDLESELSGGDDLRITRVDNGGRELQRVPARAHRYYGSSRERQDIIMIESASAGEVEGSNVLLSGSIVRRKVYIAKVQAFLVIQAPRGMTSDSSAEDEVCLFRYYDPVELSSLDSIYRALKCVKLRWSTKESEEFEVADFGVDCRSAAVQTLPTSTFSL